MAHAFVVDEHAVPGRRADGDTALEKTTIGSAEGCEVLEQRVMRFAPGRSLERGDAERQEVLFVVRGATASSSSTAAASARTGHGRLPRAGERYSIDNPARRSSSSSRSRRPASTAAAAPPRHRPLRRAAELPAEDSGVPLPRQSGRRLSRRDAVRRPRRSRRAPDHSHTYDEVVYIIEGRGSRALGRREFPLAPGYVSPSTARPVHCLENSGPDEMGSSGSSTLRAILPLDIGTTRSASRGHSP